MTIEIRAAVEADLPEILAIYNAAVRETTAIYTEQEASLAERAAWRAARLALGYAVLGAGDGAQLGGKAWLYRGWPDARGGDEVRSLAGPSVDADEALSGSF